MGDCSLRPPYLSPFMMPDNKLLRAIEFAENAHKGQVRKGTDTPYSVHPKTVADFLGDALCQEDIIVAGVLHDTLEDTGTKESDIRELFGDRVLALIKEVSEPDKSLSWEERKKHTIESVKTISTEAAMIMCADKLHNILSMLGDLKEMAERADGFGDFEERFWSRFKAPIEKQKWYYTEVADALMHKLKDENMIVFVYELWNNIEIVFQTKVESFLWSKIKVAKSDQETLDILEPYLDYSITEMKEEYFPVVYSMVKTQKGTESLKEYMRERILKGKYDGLYYLIEDWEKIWNLNRID